MTYMDEYRQAYGDAYGGQWREPDPEYPQVDQVTCDMPETASEQPVSPEPLDYLVCEECGSDNFVAFPAFGGRVNPFCFRCGSTRLVWASDLTHTPVVDYRDGGTP